MRKRERLPDEILLSRMLSRRFIDPVTDCWIYTGAKHRRGYGSLWNGIRHGTVSRISAEIFLGLALNDKRLVCHHCDIPACFNPVHLFFGTQADNLHDCRAKGRAYKLPPRTHEQSGEKNASAKLTWKQVAEIRYHWMSGRQNQRLLARQYGVSQSLISMIVNKIIWEEVGEAQ